MDPVNDAALEREIERALAVDPSPEFLVRVRARIADEPAPASRGFGWLFAGVATVAAAAALVLAVRMVSPARPSETAPLLASRSIGSIVVPKGVGRHDQHQYVVSGFSRTQRESSGFSRTQRESLRPPEPLFDARETTALQRLIADVRDARVDLAPLLKEGPMPVRSNEDLVIPPIVIEPLETSGIQGERP